MQQNNADASATTKQPLQDQQKAEELTEPLNQAAKRPKQEESGV